MIYMLPIVNNDTVCTIRIVIMNAKGENIVFILKLLIIL